MSLRYPAYEPHVPGHERAFAWHGLRRLPVHGLLAGVAR
jgi:hypothetical protein